MGKKDEKNTISATYDVALKLVDGVEEVRDASEQLGQEIDNIKRASALMAKGYAEMQSAVAGFGKANDETAGVCRETLVAVAGINNGQGAIIKKTQEVLDAVRDQGDTERLIGKLTADTDRLGERLDRISRMQAEQLSAGFAVQGKTTERALEAVEALSRRQQQTESDIASLKSMIQALSRHMDIIYAIIMKNEASASARAMENAPAPKPLPDFAPTPFMAKGIDGDCAAPEIEAEYAIEKTGESAAVEAEEATLGKPEATLEKPEATPETEKYAEDAEAEAAFAEEATLEKPEADVEAEAADCGSQPEFGLGESAAEL